jgi:hypothetical protein
VEVTFPDSDTVRYVWYTKDMKVVAPNRMTPFRPIDGVLMEFFYIIGDAELQFMADEVFVRDIPDKSFEKRKHYMEVTGGYLDTLIMKMISF